MSVDVRRRAEFRNRSHELKAEAELEFDPERRKQLLDLARTFEKASEQL